MTEQNDLDTEHYHKDGSCRVCTIHFAWHSQPCEPKGDTVTEPGTDPNVLLTQMRNYAAKAREGTDVRDSERRVRWNFEKLDQLLTTGAHEIPHDWISKSHANGFALPTAAEIHGAYVILRYCPGGPDVSEGLLRMFSVREAVITAARERIDFDVKNAGASALDKLGYRRESPNDKM
jgi:hypothetical protein